MDSIIRVMPESLTNQIAAGEVVERPASIVKELVENALDAGAAHVTVEYAAGGTSLVRVVDDGTGMSREDAPLALERHATSKLITIDDLRNIRTFGFRGEALPSIASVSHFKLRTRRAADTIGTEVTLDERGARLVADTSMPPGTEVEVRDLFHSVPARRKFLRKEATEAGAIVETVQRMALSNPGVHFTLLAEGRTVVNAPAETDRLARIYALLGKKVCEHLYECFIDGRIRVSGFISSPESKRRDASGMFTFVNERFVKDKVVSQAVVSAYSTLLSRGEYPWAILSVSVPPTEVDVNVHPAKSEVRFERSSEVFAAVNRAVRLTLIETPWVKGKLVDMPSAEAPPVALHTRAEVVEEAPAVALHTRAEVVEEAPPVALHSRAEVLRSVQDDVAERRSRSLPSMEADRTEQRGPAREGSAAVVPQLVSPLREGYPEHREGGGGSGRIGPSFRDITYLGQFANCFLLCQMGNRLVVIDQHAAHERVMFEKLKAQLDSGPVVSQRLLVPMVVEMDLRLVAALEAQRELVARLGFGVEPFGGRSVAITAVPLLLKQRNPEVPLVAVLSDVAGVKEPSADELFHRTLATMACHSAVRSGDPMDRREVLELLKLMDGVDLAAYCPHGRPVVAMFDESEVGRWFKRT